MRRAVSAAALLVTTIAALGACAPETQDESIASTDSALNAGATNYAHRVVLENLDFSAPPNYPMTGWSVGGRERLVADVSAAIAASPGCPAISNVREGALASEKYFVLGSGNLALDAFTADWDVLRHIEGCR